MKARSALIQIALARFHRGTSIAVRSVRRWRKLRISTAAVGIRSAKAALTKVSDVRWLRCPSGNRLAELKIPATALLGTTAEDIASKTLETSARRREMLEHMFHRQCERRLNGK